MNFTFRKLESPHAIPDMVSSGEEPAEVFRNDYWLKTPASNSELLETEQALLPKTLRSETIAQLGALTKKSLAVLAGIKCGEYIPEHFLHVGETLHLEAGEVCGGIVIAERLDYTGESPDDAVTDMRNSHRFSSAWDGTQHRYESVRSVIHDADNPTETTTRSKYFRDTFIVSSDRNGVTCLNLGTLAMDEHCEPGEPETSRATVDYRAFALCRTINIETADTEVQRLTHRSFGDRDHALGSTGTLWEMEEITLPVGQTCFSTGKRSSTLRRITRVMLV